MIAITEDHIYKVAASGRSSEQSSLQSQNGGLAIWPFFSHSSCSWHMAHLRWGYGENRLQRNGRCFGPI